MTTPGGRRVPAGCLVPGEAQPFRSSGTNYAALHARQRLPGTTPKPQQGTPRDALFRFNAPGRYAWGGRVVHHVVGVLTGIGVAERALPGLVLLLAPASSPPSPMPRCSAAVVPVGFGEVRVNVVPSGAGKGEVI